ncbi:MAG: hypothetical protein ABFD44_14525 [Anaerolineaceae bacterium]
MHKEQEIHGIQAWELQDILVKIGGVCTEEGEYQGNRWKANFIRLPDYMIGKLSLCNHQVMFEGDPEVLPEIWRQFELRIFRPGG